MRAIINSQSLEDTQVGYISQKYTWEEYTLEKYTLEKFLILDFFGFFPGGETFFWGGG